MFTLKSLMFIVKFILKTFQATMVAATEFADAHQRSYFNYF